MAVLTNVRGHPGIPEGGGVKVLKKARPYERNFQTDKQNWQTRMG